MLNRFKGIKLKWYHLVVFCLPGGIFMLTCLLAYQYKDSNII